MYIRIYICMYCVDPEQESHSYNSMSREQITMATHQTPDKQDSTGKF